MALGAKVRTAASIPANLNLYDFVMIEDREKITLTREQRSSRKLANTAWLKACLPVGKFLAPALISTAE
jgi:hypothetical protein